MRKLTSYCTRLAIFFFFGFLLFFGIKQEALAYGQLATDLGCPASCPSTPPVSASGYTVGYSFTPHTTGTITALGGNFPGTATVVLWDGTGVELARVSNLNSSSSWVNGNTVNVTLTSGQTYYIGVQLPIGGSFNAASHSMPYSPANGTITYIASYLCQGTGNLKTGAGCAGGPPGPLPNLDGIPDFIFKCTLGSSPDASCNSGNISNLNFGITNQVPWFQGFGGDMRLDNGFTDNVPSPSSFYASNIFPTTPGMIFSGGANASFGASQTRSSTTQWVSGSTSYPEVFTPPRTGLITTSYDYLNGISQENGITIGSLPSGCTNVSGCSLNQLLPGIYADTSGSPIYITASKFCGDNGQCQSQKGPGFSGNWVVLVKGDLHILGSLYTPPRFTFTLSVKGNIYIDPSVGEALGTVCNPQANGATGCDIDGLISTDKSLIVSSTGSCATEKQLNFDGAMVVNAALAGGTVQNSRDFCANDPSYPTITYTERPDMVANAPQFIAPKPVVWQEQAP